MNTWNSSRKMSPGSRYFSGSAFLVKYTTLAITSSRIDTDRISHDSARTALMAAMMPKALTTAISSSLTTNPQPMPRQLRACDSDFGLRVCGAFAATSSFGTDMGSSCIRDSRVREGAGREGDLPPRGGVSRWLLRRR